MVGPRSHISIVEIESQLCVSTVSAADMCGVGRLPVEILLRIFSNLSGIDLVNCSLVCKHWYKITSTWDLWLNVYLKEVKPRAWIDRQQAILQTAIVSNMHSQDNPDVKCERHKCVQYVKQFVVYTQKIENTATHTVEQTQFHSCVLIGPGIDESGVGGQFCKTLLSWTDINYLRQRNDSDQVMNDRWISPGMMLRLPSGNNVLVTFVHARVYPSRSNLYGGGNRADGSLLVLPDHDGEESERIQLIPQLQRLIEYQHTVIYTINGTQSASNAAGFPVKQFWHSVRQELSAVVECMQDHQKLLILGICNKYDGTNNTELMDLIDFLGGAWRSSTNEGLQPLVKCSLNYRVWCLTSDNREYSNIEQIFDWVIV